MILNSTKSNIIGIPVTADIIMELMKNKPEQSGKTINKYTTAMNSLSNIDTYIIDGGGILLVILNCI